MKKIIIPTAIIIVLCVVGFVLFFNKDNKLVHKSTNIVEKDSKTITSDEKDDTKKDDVVDTKEVINNESEKKEDSVVKDSTSSSTKKSENNNNSTSNSKNNTPVVENKPQVSSQPVQTTEPVIENTTPPTPPTPSCTPKKFINSWFIGEFRSQQACLDAGEKYMFDYSVSCPYLDDDCGTTYWMLQLIDREGNIVDYHTLN